MGRYSASACICELISKGDLEGVKKKISYNPSLLNKPINKIGDTPLNYCLFDQFREENIAAWLIGYGADLNLQNKYGWTALIYACRYDQPQTAELLINKGAKVDLQNDYGWTALMYACAFNQPQTAKRLINDGAKIDLQNNYGGTALMLAVRYGQHQTAQLLINKAAKIDLKQKNGWTVLTYARKFNQPQIAKLLICKRAKIDLQNNYGSRALNSKTKNYGETALEIAKRHGRNEVVEFCTDHDVGFLQALEKECLKELDPVTFLQKLPSNISNCVKLKLLYTCASAAFKNKLITKPQRNKVIDEALGEALKIMKFGGETTKVAAQFLSILRKAKEDHVITQERFDELHHRVIRNDVFNAPEFLNVVLAVQENRARILSLGEYVTILNENMKRFQKAYLEARKRSAAFSIVSGIIGMVTFGIGKGVMDAVTPIIEGMMDYVVDFSDYDLLAKVAIEKKLVDIDYLRQYDAETFSESAGDLSRFAAISQFETWVNRPLDQKARENLQRQLPVLGLLKTAVVISNITYTSTVTNTQSKTAPYDWFVSAKEKTEYVKKFDELKTDHFVNGFKVANFMKQFGLQNSIEEKIWHLVDVDRNGTLDECEFIALMKLIKAYQSGCVLPNDLPCNLKPLSSRGSQPELDYYRKEFEALQPDPSGKLDFIAVSPVFVKADLPNVKQWLYWRTVDRDQDGFINFMEFKNLMELIDVESRCHYLGPASSIEKCPTTTVKKYSSMIHILVLVCCSLPLGRVVLSYLFKSYLTSTY